MFLDFRGLDELLRISERVDFRREFERFKTAKHHVKDVTSEELAAALAEARREFIAGSGLENESAGFREIGALRRLLIEVERAPLYSMSDHQVCLRILHAVNYGALVVWPSDSTLAQSIVRARARRAWMVRGAPAAGSSGTVSPLRGKPAAVTPSPLRKEAEAHTGFVQGTTPRIQDVSGKIAETLRKPKGSLTRAEIDAQLNRLNALDAANLSNQERLNHTALWMALTERASAEGLMTPQEVVGSKHAMQAATGAMMFSGGAGSASNRGGAVGAVLPRTTGSRVRANHAGVVIDQKIRRQMHNRGWTENDVHAVIKDGRTGKSVDRRSAAKTPDRKPRNDNASVYGVGKAHIVVNDRTLEVTQVNRKDDEWIVDSRIKWNKYDEH